MSPDNQIHYEVTVSAVNENKQDSITQEFQLEDLQYQLIPENFRVSSISSTTVTLEWSDVTSDIINYEICYKEEQSPQIQDICVTR